MIYPITLNAVYSGTISGLVIQSSSGTATGTVTIDGVPVTGLTDVAVSSTEETYLATGANTFVVGQDIVFDMTETGTPLNVSINLQVVRASISACPASTLVTTTSGVTIDSTKEENLNYPLSNGVSLYTVPFAVEKTDSSGSPTIAYNVLLESPVENLVDDATLSIDARVVGKTSTSLTILLDGNPDSANYVLKGNVKVI